MFRKAAKNLAPVASERTLPVRTPRPVVMAVLAAHLWCWGILGFLFFGPAYRGVTESGAEVTRSFFEVNGYGLLPVGLAPVFATGMALFGFVGRLAPLIQPRTTLWLVAVFLLIYCLLALFSVGFLFAPAMALMFAAASANTWWRGGTKASSARQAP